jgi:hypothetical protein
LVLTVVDSESGEKSNCVSRQFGKRNHCFAVVDVEVEKRAQPLYVVTSSRHAVIWRFHGEFASISRVISLGAIIDGDHAAGFIGLLEQRISFVSHLKDIRVPTPIGQQPAAPLKSSDLSTRCGPSDAFHACVADTYLFRVPVSKDEPFAVGQWRGLGGVTTRSESDSRAEPLPAGVLPPGALDEPERMIFQIGSAPVTRNGVTMREVSPEEIDDAEVIWPSDGTPKQ